MDEHPDEDVKPARGWRARLRGLWARWTGRTPPTAPPSKAPAAPPAWADTVPPEQAPPVAPPREQRAPAPAPVAPAERPPPAPPRAAPQAVATFVEGSWSNAAGTRPYLLFLPGTESAALRPLVVMLHGCRQNPRDFAAGTRMNDLAQAHGIVVLYPGQVAQANQFGCWNWFREDNQRRDAGEPSLIADMTRHVIETQRIDPRRVYIAGLSAGGAMAAVLAATYPDLYAGVGIHSGLPHAAANSLVTALSAMRHGPLTRAAAAPRAERVPVPTIVLHGEEDTTVHPDNGDEVIAQARWGREATEDADGTSGMSVERGHVPGGRTYTRTIHRDADGRCDAEHWLVHGSGHAWSGGSAIGSYTDPLGPDASVQMLRFFIEHPKAGG